MELIIDRKYKKHNYTISNLYINNKWLCNVLEDADRGLDNSMCIDEILELKKPNITAIPKGTYEITLDVISSKYSKVQFYKDVCNGKVPRLKNVKGFDGILIHAGNTDKDTSGCLLVGLNKVKGQVINSKDIFKNLYKILEESNNKGEKLIIKIL